jgi:excisionase family DNA binding protein
MTAKKLRDNVKVAIDPRQYGVFKAGYLPSEAANVLGLGLSKTYEAISEGRLRSVLYGKRRIVLGVSIAQMLHDLEQEGLRFNKSPNPDAGRVIQKRRLEPSAQRNPALQGAHRSDAAEPDYNDPPSDFKTWVTEDEEIV